MITQLQGMNDDKGSASGDSGLQSILIQTRILNLLELLPFSDI